jgi:hypothetical protein
MAKWWSMILGVVALVAGGVVVATPAAAETVPPSVNISSPPAGNPVYSRNQAVTAQYACFDNPGGSGIDTCAGTVPSGSPINTSTYGQFNLTVTATDNDGNQTVVQRPYQVRDLTAPNVTITTPALGGPTYTRGQDVLAAYGCVDEPGGSGIATCSGPVPSGQPIDTTSLGPKSFTVTAVDNQGNVRQVNHPYTVRDGTAPTIDLTIPADDAVYDRGESVVADYSCGDEAGGSGLASCVGSLPDGAELDTSTLGPDSFTVTAGDAHGNTREVTHSYVIRDPESPVVAITTPEDGATYPRGAVVEPDFTCMDDPDGSGIASCESNGIDTSTLGPKTFTVTAVDHDGNRTVISHHYTVVDATAPTATIASPLDGATFTRGQQVPADYSCADDAQGSGIDTCEGDVGDGTPIDTSTLGLHQFSVVATDLAGNSVEVTAAYTVEAPRCAGRAVTVVLGLGEVPTAGRDVILGTPGPDTVNGLGGNDLICVLGGDDRASGGKGADVLYGADGADLLKGGNGNDQLNGGPQRDTCQGQRGPRDRQTGCEVRTGIP